MSRSIPRQIEPIVCPRCGARRYTMQAALEHLRECKPLVMDKEALSAMFDAVGRMSRRLGPR